MRSGRIMNMRRSQKIRIRGRRSTFSGHMRTIVLGLSSPARRKALSPHEVKLWAAATRRGYLGLLIGVGVGLVLLAMVLLSD
jgi:hypothetical protein